LFWANLYSAKTYDELNLPLPFESAEIRAILLDIEGTTTPFDFVYKTLFPFASTHVEDFLHRRIQEPEIAELIEQLAAAHARDAAFAARAWLAGTPEEQVMSAAIYVRWLIGRDSKITPLKTLQGKIWQEGFLRDELKGEVYPDVAPAFARWKAQGRRLAIFSSGSILAQQLLFAHSDAGDLSSFLEGYFDTTTGTKRDEVSYRLIADSLDTGARHILFLSDVVAELDAARASGLKTALSLRPGIVRPRIAVHPEIRDFSEVFADSKDCSRS
jgi:enolase-phosphatase E1